MLRNDPRLKGRARSLRANLIDAEVDGSQHAGLWQAEYDKRRTACFEDIGLRLLRFNDLEVLLEIDSVTDRIFRAVTKSP